MNFKWICNNQVILQFGQRSQLQLIDDFIQLMVFMIRNNITCIT